MNYQSPENVTVCRCLAGGGGIAAAMFCSTGHMTECHYPLGCREAACGHLDRYRYDTCEDGDAQDHQEIEKTALALVVALADPRCERCGGRGGTETETVLEVELTPEMHAAVGGVFTVNARVICPCVVRTVETATARETI